MKYSQYLTGILCAAAAAVGISCIENDIPYPKVEVYINAMTGEGFTAVSDPSKRTVTLTLDERTDIRNVKIDRAELGVTPHATSLSAEELIAQVRTSQPLTGTFDMRTPLYTTLSLYQDYEWTIGVRQEIEYLFAVEGQVGATVIDPGTRTATAYVAKDADLTKVVVTSLKLGPAEITTCSPALEELSGTSFETVRFVDATCHGRTERWLLYVKPTDKSVELTGAYAWSKVVWLYGSGIEGVKSGFRYKTGDETEWHEVPDVTSDGGSFSAHLAAEPETQYTFMAYCGSDETDPVSVTTERVEPLLNGGFEDWCTGSDDIVYPYASGAEPYWSTGNKGAKIANATLTDKCPPRPGSTGQYAACLKSQFANLVGLGKFAAGNLFMGDYVRNEGTNGVLTFGRPFTLRPTRLRIWVKYRQGVIDKLKSVPVGSNIKLGDPDNGHIYIALGTWSPAEYGKDSKGKQVGTTDSPICVDTRDVSTFFRKDGKDVIAYGEYVFDADTEKAFAEHVDGWVTMDIKLDYRVKDVVPTHMMIVCSASRWGDYFTGSTKSEMWVDDFELIYD